MRWSSAGRVPGSKSDESVGSPGDRTCGQATRVRRTNPACRERGRGTDRVPQLGQRGSTKPTGSGSTDSLAQEFLLKHPRTSARTSCRLIRIEGLLDDPILEAVTENMLPADSHNMVREVAMAGLSGPGRPPQRENLQYSLPGSAPARRRGGRDDQLRPQLRPRGFLACGPHHSTVRQRAPRPRAGACPTVRSRRGPRRSPSGERSTTSRRWWSSLKPRPASEHSPHGTSRPAIPRRRTIPHRFDDRRLRRRGAARHDGQRP